MTKTATKRTRLDLDAIQKGLGCLKHLLEIGLLLAALAALMSGRAERISAAKDRAEILKIVAAQNSAAISTETVENE